MNAARSLTVIAFGSLLSVVSGCVSSRSNPAITIPSPPPRHETTRNEPHGPPTGSVETKTQSVIQASAVSVAKPDSESQPTNPGTETLLSVKDAPPIPGGNPSTGGPMDLGEVLVCVERHYPLLRAIEQERRIAGGRLVSSLGAFDFNLTSGVEGQGTTYDNLRSSLGVSQAIPFGGIGTFAGYRNGYGEFPTYQLGQKTADGGEFRAGLTFPLLRDRDIDRPRATIQQARLDIQLAEPLIDRQRLDFQRAAARTYWNWVASGQRLKVVRSLVDLAVERDEQLKARVEAGPSANIERIDNQQNVALRNGLLVQSQRTFQQATIELSLFLRDATGNPLLAGVDRVPEFPVVATGELPTFDESLRTAFSQRPEPRRIRMLHEKAAVDYRLAVNQAQPTVNAIVVAAQDVGAGRSSVSGPQGLDRTTVGAGISVLLPLQQREARGRVLQAQALMNQLEQQYLFAEDVVRAEVQDTFTAWERAYELLQQARKRINLARTVAQAERELLRLGRSDILRVTLREQAAFEAAVIEIGALQDYFRARAEFQVAIGEGPTR